MVGTPIAGWSIMENHIKVDDLGVPPFQETTIYVCVSVTGGETSQICFSIQLWLNYTRVNVDVGTSGTPIEHDLLDGHQQRFSSFCI